MLALEGEDPATVDIDSIGECVARVREPGTLCLAGARPVCFLEKDDLVLDGWRELPVHDRAAIGAGARIRGRAVVEEPDGVIVLSAVWALASADELVAELAEVAA